MHEGIVFLGDDKTSLEGFLFDLDYGFTSCHDIAFIHQRRIVNMISSLLIRPKRCLFVDVFLVALCHAAMEGYLRVGVCRKHSFNVCFADMDEVCWQATFAAEDVEFLTVIGVVPLPDAWSSAVDHGVCTCCVRRIGGEVVQ